MKLLSINNISFKGYDAQPLRALYMQSAKSEPQKMIYKELSEIGKVEHFDVFMHTEDGLASKPAELRKQKYSVFNPWAQDNKMFVKKNGAEVLLYPKCFIGSNNTEAELLKGVIDVPSRESELIIEGGNIFVGKKPDGKNYIIIGEDCIQVSAIYQFLKSKNIDKLSDGKLREFSTYGSVANQIGLFSEPVTVRDYYPNQEYWEQYARELFMEEFEVESEDLCVISQPNYHIDLAIRPLEYPYVLVNDDELASQNLEKVKEKLGRDGAKFVRQFKHEQSNIKNNYKSSQEIARQLEQKGFIPILVGGGYGTCKVNFMNAIVNKRASGQLSYITNSAECEDERYSLLQEEFLSELKEKYPKIDRFYFVKGGDYKNKSNIIMNYLKRFKGGIHCLCAERPIFK